MPLGRRQRVLIGAGLALAVLALLLVVRATMASGSSVRAVTVDPEALARVPGYAEAHREVAQRSAEVSARLERVRGSGKPGSPDVQEEMKAAQEDLARFRRERLGPLEQRLSRTLGAVARGHGAVAVLDSRVVLEGLPDVTEEVAERLQREEEPREVALPERSAVGYVDQDRLARLPMFQNVERRLLNYHDLLGREFRKKQAGRDEAALVELDRTMAARFEERRAALYAPLQKRVRQALEGLARGEGVGVILDRRQVLWGGRDLTPEVVARLAPGAAEAEGAEARPAGRVGVVSVSRVLSELPEYEVNRRRYEEEQRKLLGGVDPDDPYASLSKKRAEIEASMARWNRLKQAFIEQATTRMREAAREVAEDKDLAFVLLDAPWNPGPSLAQFGATDVTTDLLLEMKE